MTKQTVKSASVTSNVRDQLNENFTEVYSDITSLETGKVPYTGATSTIDLGSQKIITEEIESVGDLTIDCGTEKTLVFTEAIWDDLRFPANVGKLGANAKPDYDYTNNGFLFPQNDTAEVAYFTGQMPHSFEIGSTIYPHLHFIQTSSSVPVFKLKYRIYDQGAAVPSFTTLTSTGVQHTYTSGSIHQMLLFSGIDTTSVTGISALIDLQLYREDNVVTGDVLVKEFDIHYQSETLGSRTATTK